MIVRSLSLVILVSFLRLPFFAMDFDGWSVQENRSVLSVVNVAGFPTWIIHASIESQIVSSWVEIEVYNNLPEIVQELRFQIRKPRIQTLLQTAL